MARNQIYRYYVEGATDKKIVDTLKTEYRIIQPGKTSIFNATCDKFRFGHIRELKHGTIVILVFDTDRVGCGSYEILSSNIEFLKKAEFIKKVICVTQVLNLEDELVRSCKINSVSEITDSKSDAEFKVDILKISNLRNKLDQKSFDFSEFWINNPKNEYRTISNGADEIKIR